MSGIMRAGRAIIKLSLFFLLSLGVFLVQIPVLLITRGPASYVIPYFWHKAVRSVFGISVTVEGYTPHKSQTLYLANHMSYLDIITLGSIIRGVSFVSKAEVKNWPLIGQLCALQQTAFIHRKREEAQKQQNDLTAMLKNGKSLVIFPEGTTTDGRSVYPFKSSLFALALEHKDHLTLQPISLVLESADHQDPQEQDVRDLYSWHINLDISFASHLWKFAAARGAKLRIIFHAPVHPNDFEDRKTLAKHCADIVSQSITDQSKIKTKEDSQ